QPGGAELSLLGEAGEYDGRTYVRGRRRPAGAEEGEGRLAGCGLQNRKRALPLCSRLRRRELEPQTPGPTHAAGRERHGGRVPAGRERARSARGLEFGVPVLDRKSKRLKSSH